jgi:hypothetical protein
MRRSVAAAAALALALAALGEGGGGLVQAKIDPNDKGEPLFPDGHPNITFLTDDNWDEHLAKTDKPWLIDFYHPLYVLLTPGPTCVGLTRD